MTRVRNALVALCAFLAACSSFGTTAPAATDSGAPPGTSCWPSGGCTGNQICCVAKDGTSACTIVAACPAEHAQLACIRPSDCPASQICCEQSLELVDAGKTEFIPTSSCRAACEKAAGFYRLCEGPADCPSSTSCGKNSLLVPPDLAICM